MDSLAGRHRRSQGARDRQAAVDLEMRDAMQYQAWSYRFAEQVLNSRLALRKEIEDIIRDVELPPDEYKREELNDRFLGEFEAHGWKKQPRVFAREDVDDEAEVPLTKIDFLKERTGVEVQFGHSSFIGIDLLKFQTLSYANLDKIDVGVYIVVTNALHKATGKAFNGSLMFEKVVRYLPHFRSAIQVPIWVIGLIPS
jgi:hypothetical protein